MPLNKIAIKGFRNTRIPAAQPKNLFSCHQYKINPARLVRKICFAQTYITGINSIFEYGNFEKTAKPEVDG
jgi:hypothetical protein